MFNVLVSSQRGKNFRVKRNHPREVLKTTSVNIEGDVDVQERKLLFMSILSPYFINTTGKSFNQELRSK